MNIFAKLIPIGNCPSFGDGLIDTVNARDLHRALKVKRDFTNWVKDRIESCQFQEDQDYVVFAKSGVNPLGGRPTTEYFLTLDAAKHFAMLERNDQGFKVRQYFVEFEKQAKKMLPAGLNSEIAQAVAAAMGPALAEFRQLSSTLDIMAPKALVFDKVLASKDKGVVAFTRMLEGANSMQVQAALAELGYLIRVGYGSYRVASPYRGSHFSEKYSRENPQYAIIVVEAEGMKLLARLHSQDKLPMLKSYEKIMKKGA